MAEACSGSPASEAHIACTSERTAGSYLRIPSSSGQSAEGSELASALWTATWTIFGVKRSASTAAMSSRAASASPKRNRSQARSATQSTGFTFGGEADFASSASRIAICAQRDAMGVRIRRIRVDRNGPSAVPHNASPSPRLRGSSAPTVHGSRRAQPGYSTGGDGGTTAAVGFELEISSIALSSAPPSGKVAEELAGDALFCVGVDGAGCGGTDCWASAGSARTTAAATIRMVLVRIASGGGHGDLDRVGRLLLRQPRQEEQGH